MWSNGNGVLKNLGDKYLAVLGNWSKHSLVRSPCSEVHEVPSTTG